jgi:hypothetical protein
MTQINKVKLIILCKTGRDGRTMWYVGVKKMQKGLVERVRESPGNGWRDNIKMDL